MPPIAVLFPSYNNARIYHYPVPAQVRFEERPQKLFRPRTVGRSRVSIGPVAPGDFERKRKHRYPTSDPPKPWFKLAVSRENAKRLLRSVINHPDHPGQAQSKRRSWSPPKPEQTGQRSGSGFGGSSRGISDESVPSMRGGIRSSISGPANGHPVRPRLASDATAQSSVSSQGSMSTPTSHPSPDGIIPSMKLDEVKPVASGNGVSVGIHLAEPVLFLQGFENPENLPGNTAMLRGGLHIRVQKAAKIKAITLKFKGKATTKWPEGIPPRKTEFEEVDTIMSHTWPFFNAQFESAEKGTNADHVQLFRGSEVGSSRLDTLAATGANGSSPNLTSKEAKKLALSVNQSRSFGKGDQPPGGPGVAAKGYRTFLPGDYIYNFELPLDSRLPETIDVELGSVRYEVEATVERSGAFRPSLIGNKEITLIRAPAEGSLEQVEPIAISRNWEDQLHYDIVISGKSFPLGSQVPIAFKLTPLAKVQCHRIKVLITENIEYFCSNKRVHRMEPVRKLQLFEKRADGPPTSAFPGSSMRITSGGGVPYDQRVRAARGEDVVPNDTTNLLGSLEGESNIGPTEMEFNVQLPSCHTMKERDRTQRLHFDTTYQNIQVHHWIKIVMRLSKPDVDNPGKRRHFEISIDSPFHILSCRATQANISLPAYSMPEGAQNSNSLYECGCPGAARRRNSPTSFLPTLNALNAHRSSISSSTADSPSSDRPNTPTGTPSPGLARPPIAHLPANGTHSTNLPNPILQRPMLLLRAPSFNPPAFEDSDPPPPLITPPPQYDSIASPTHGLADYFARLSDTYEDEEEEDEYSRFRGGEEGLRRVGSAAAPGGRVDVPLTPGGRVNRSMDLRRNWVPVGGL